MSRHRLCIAGHGKSWSFAALIAPKRGSKQQTWPALSAATRAFRAEGTDYQLSRYSEQMRKYPGPGTDKIVRHGIPRGMTATGVFLFFGAAMASLAGTTLSWPGTSLDRVWALNPTAHKQLATFAKPAGILFLVLAATLALAGTGWFQTPPLGVEIGRGTTRDPGFG